MLKSVPPPARWFQRTTTTTTAMAGGGGFGGQLNHRCCWRTNSNSMMMMSRRGFWTLEGGNQHHSHHRSPKRRHGGTGKSISTRFEERANSTKRWRDECCYDDIYAPSSRLGRSVTNGTTFATRALAENGHDDDRASSSKKGKEEEVQFFFVERISPTEKNAFCDLGHHTRSIFTNHRNNRDENPKPLDKDRDTINTAS